MLSAECRPGDQEFEAPMALCDQSKDRTSLPISPPAKKAGKEYVPLPPFAFPIMQEVIYVKIGRSIASTRIVYCFSSHQSIYHENYPQKIRDCLKQVYIAHVFHNDVCLHLGTAWYKFGNELTVPAR
jgi:hypothetical protein